MDTIEHLITLTNSYYTRGWTPATSSNFSIRETQNTALITRSGCHKGRLTPSDFMKIAVSGAVIDHGQPSAETGLHLMLYQTEPQINTVLHTHSPKAVTLSMLTHSETLTFVNYEILKAFPKINTHASIVQCNIFDNTQNIPELVALISPMLPMMQLPGFIIRGHGIYSWGATLADADKHLEAIEYLIECELLRRQIK